jgi:hypothetical protein
MHRKSQNTLAPFLLAAISFTVSCCLAEYVLRALRPDPAKQQSTVSLPYRAVRHSSIGYTNPESISYRAAVSVQNKICYDVTYTLDEQGRRVVLSQPKEQQAHILLLGDSITFGSGLADVDTWQYALSQRAHVLNYSVFGYGPQHVLAQLESDLIQPPPDHSTMLWTLLPVHLLRAQGDLDTPFWEEGPAYIQEGSHLRLLGKFQDTYPWQTFFEQRFNSLALFHLIRDNWRKRKLSSYADWTSHFVIQGNETIEKRFPSELLIVLHPMWSNPLYEHALQTLKAHLSAADIPIIDFSDMPYTEKDMIGDACDAHPGAKFTKKYAERLIQELENRQIL